MRNAEPEGEFPGCQDGHTVNIALPPSLCKEAAQGLDRYIGPKSRPRPLHGSQNPFNGHV